MSKEEIIRILEEFKLNDVADIEQLKSGNINTTYSVVVKRNGRKEHYILQQVNTKVFRHPHEVMNNIISVCNHLKEKNKKKYGDYHRRCMNFVSAKDGYPFYESEEDGFWRCFEFIEGATAYDKVEKIEHFESAGAAFGEFQRMLSDFDAANLYETIPGFHNTKSRYKGFVQDVEADVAKRVSEVEAEVEEILSRKDLAESIVNMLQADELPLRVTHNDTKLNNIMIDNESGEGICVIDLDTIMPGSTLFDFGDAIRFGANHTEEDDENLDEVYLDLELFAAFTEGFVKGAGDFLTEKEIENLAAGALVITYEQALRFLDDYINGDTYFKTYYPKHNLVRARNQICLLKDMEQKYDQMQAIVQKSLHN